MSNFFQSLKSSERTFDIILIGGSWGGMDALIKILRILPANFSIPIVAVLHRQKDSESDLIRILHKYLKLHIKEIDEKEPIQKGCLYIGPQNYHVLVEEEKIFSLCASETVNYARPSIDVFFESAAKVYKEKAIGMLLTGANADGGEGLKTISELGGLTIIQDPEDAESPYMPLFALKILKPDYILTKEEMSEFLMNLIER